MSGEREAPDPFAGYTPVKVAPIAGSDPDPRTPAAEKPPRKYRFGKKREGGVSRTVKFFGLVLVSLVLLALIAILSYGFIYERPLDGSLTEGGPLTNCVRRLSEFGCGARMRVRAAMAAGAGEASAESRSSSSKTNDMTQTGSLVPLLGTVLNQSRQMKESIRLLDDAECAPAATTLPTDVEASDKGGKANQGLKRFKGGREGLKIKSGGLR